VKSAYDASDAWTGSVEPMIAMAASLPAQFSALMESKNSLNLATGISTGHNASSGG
jgi:hypothetical protein